MIFTEENRANIDITHNTMYRIITAVGSRMQRKNKGTDVCVVREETLKFNNFNKAGQSIDPFIKFKSREILASVGLLKREHS